MCIDRIDVSEGTDVNASVVSKNCDTCHYWSFLNYSFKFQPNVCNRCHDLLMSMNLSDIAILNIKGSDYCCIISLVSKNEAMTLIRNCWFDWKNWNIIKHKNLLSRINRDKKIRTIGDVEIEKNKCYRNKTPILLKNVDIEKVLVPNKISFGERRSKYSSGYNDNKVYPLHIMLLKISAYVTCFDVQTKWMSFNRDLSREFGISNSSFSPSSHETHFQKEFCEGNLLFIHPNIIISWVPCVSTNTCNW